VLIPPTGAATAASGASSADLPDTVIRWVTLAALLALAWFALKGLARRGRLLRAHEWLDPRVQALRNWVAAAPAVFTYVAVWTATSVVQQGTPASLADLNAAVSSTNIANLLTEPVRVLFTSAVIVADNGYGFILYVIVYVLIAARLEHRVGSARWVTIAAASHVLGSLLTVEFERLGIARDLLPASIVLTQDVGVSYVMVGSLGAYLWLVGPRWRWPYRVAVAVGILGPLVLSHTIWDLGHFLATAIGTLVGWLVIRWPLRDRLVWRQLTQRPPRRLPTFDDTCRREPLAG
jgi:hypothetical protein